MNHYELTVRGFHLDLYQHVNNARYLEYLEEARWQFFNDTKVMNGLDEKGLVFVLVNVNINYRQPALMNQRLVIKTNFLSFGKSSCKLSQTIILKDDDSVIVDAEITFVLLDPLKNKACQFDASLRTMLEAMMDQYGAED